MAFHQAVLPADATAKGSPIRFCIPACAAALALILVIASGQTLISPAHWYYDDPQSDVTTSSARRILRKRREDLKLPARNPFWRHHDKLRKRNPFADPKTVSDKVQNSTTTTTTTTTTGTKMGSCAVIFNSGTLLKYNDGPLIDSFDEVIRINGVKPDGFERHVGSKTTFWLVNFPGDNEKGVKPGVWFAGLNDTSVTGITTAHPVFPSQEKQYLIWRKTTLSHWILTPPSLIVNCNKLVGLRHDQWCSSGMAIVLWALDKCKSVTVFGAEEDRCYPYHFRMPMPKDCSKLRTMTSVDVFSRRTPGHAMLQEHEVLREMGRKEMLVINRMAGAKTASSS